MVWEDRYARLVSCDFQRINSVLAVLLRTEDGL
jgi:hypothetical protein